MDCIKLNKQGSVWEILFNRPKVRNAFNDKMISEMTQAFSAAKNSDDLRVLVIRGEGESFCAGADLNWMKSMVDYRMEENVADSEKLFDMFQALAEVPVPVVCMVHGHVMGGALGLVAASDIVLAEENTQFCFSEVRLGLAPAVISHFVAKKAHPTQLRRYFLTAELFDSSTAQAMGLVHESSSQGELNERLAKITKKITQNGPQAVRATKSLIDKLPYENPRSQTTHLIAKLRVSSEGQEGLKSFFDKRKPSWLDQ